LNTYVVHQLLLYSDNALLYPDVKNIFSTIYFQPTGNLNISECIVITEVHLATNN